MSVIKFDYQEVADMFACSWNHGSIGSSDAIRRFERMAESANEILKANAGAYYETYKDETVTPEPEITAAMIERGCVEIGPVSDRAKRAFRNLDSLRYNLIANNGKDFATLDILDSMLEMTRGFMCKPVAKAA